MQRGGAVPSAEDDDSALDAPAGAERYLWGLVVAVLAAAFVALIEIDAQSQRVVDPQGRAWPFSVLVGLDLTERIAGWPEVISSGLIGDPLYRTLLGWHLLADFVFLAAYGFLLVGLVRATFRTRGDRPPACSIATRATCRSSSCASTAKRRCCSARASATTTCCSPPI